MSKPDKREWYKKKRYIVPAILGFALIVGAMSQPVADVPHAETYVPKVSTPKLSPVVPKPVVSQPVSRPVSAPLSNDNYYINVDGNRVHSPAYSESVPVGASARCGDGTYSFSQHRRGTCSHHGGVMQWL
jgi:hypothetical protein